MKKLKSVFIIDNDPVANFVSEKIISFLDIAEKTTTFLGAEDALEFLNTHCMEFPDDSPQLILLDLDMPCMDGFQFIKALKKLALNLKPVVVILSTSVYPQNIDLVKSKGLKLYVAKPLDVRKMQEVYDFVNSGERDENFIFIN